MVFNRLTGVKPFLNEREAQAIFSPKGIAIAGVSRNPSSLGRKVLRNLIKSGYKGKMFLLHPKVSEIDQIPAFPDLDSIEEKLDMVVSLIPREGVKDLAVSCVKNNIPVLVVISAGFSEVGNEGKILEEDLIEYAKEHGLRIIGPNSMGVYSGNSVQGNPMDVTFTPIQPKRGSLAFLSQSGAIGAVMANHANSLNLGFSRFVSLGNKPDIDENIILVYLNNDKETEIIALYLESFNDGVIFIEQCRSISKLKPIIAVKSGRTEAGARAATSHTGALAATDAIVDAVFEQSGVIRADDISDLANIAYGFSKLQPMLGNRIAVISNAGGPGTIQTDELENLGLSVIPLPIETQERLKLFLPREASVGNPIDILPSATPEIYRKTVQTVLDSEKIDAAVVLLLPPVLFPIEEMLHGLSQVSASKPLVVVAMGCEGLVHDANSLPFPLFYLPRDAAIVLNAARRAEEFSKREYPKRSPPKPSNILTNDMEEWLSQDIIEELLAAYDITMVNQALVSTEEELMEEFERLRKPVVIKAVSPKLVHKSDLGGVITGIENFEDLQAGVTKIKEVFRKIKETDGKYLIQEQLDRDIEIVVGGLRDPQFGPMVMVGTGGIFIEVIKDAEFHVAPLTVDEALQLIEQTNLRKLLSGVRGKRTFDKSKLARLVVQVGELLHNEVRIREIDLNPVLVREGDFIPVDVRIRTQSSSK